MKGLVFAQHINMHRYFDKKTLQWVQRHDATGAFIPGAQQFCKTHGLGKPVWLDDNNDRKKMLSTIAAASDLDVIAYFGHGIPNGLPSADIYESHLDAFAEAIRSAANPGCRVVLYACSSGAEGGFAQKLGRKLHGRCIVYGHTCVGHSFTNPYVTRFPYADEDTQPFLIEPQSRQWKDWYRLIKGKSDVWARYPFMAKATLQTEIETGKEQKLDRVPSAWLIDL